MQVNEEPIVVEQSFDASKNEVWNAITDANEMCQWFFDNIPDFKAVKGFETEFDVKAPSGIFRHLWKVLEVIPLEKITVNWKFEGYRGNSHVTFELYDQDHGTKLRLTAEATESFPDDIPEFKRESGLGGWKYFINERLYKYLAS